MTHPQHIIQLVGGLTVGASGPCVLGEDGEEQLVHLRQGDADGACGPYGLMMALLLFGLTTRPQLEPLTVVHKGSRLGRFLSALSEHDKAILFKAGTKVDQLEEVIHRSFGKKLRTEATQETGAKSREFVIRSVEAGAPVLMIVAGEQFRHWLLIVGVEREATEDGSGKRTRLLALDSSVECSNVAPWNAWVQLKARKGARLPYTYVNLGARERSNVQIDAALALYRL